MRTPKIESHRLQQLAIATCAIVTIFSLSSPLSAQSLRILVRDSVTRTPLSNVLVEVLDERNAIVQSTITSNDGSRVIQLPSSGSFRVLVRSIGFRPYTTSSTRVSASDTIRLDLSIPRIPVSLARVNVTDESQCDLSTKRPGEARRVVALWDQLQTGLRLTELAQHDRENASLRTSIRQYTTHLSSRDRSVLRHTVMPAHEGQAFPFGTFKSADLSAYGYVLHTQGSAVFVAPNEQVLLSTAFASEHCFRIVEGTGEQAGLIGLAFTPKPARRVPEIAGTLWADSANGTPRYVEFWFMDNRLPEGARGPGRSGGEVYFGTLPSGAWAMRGWWLRMPQVIHNASDASLELQLLDVGVIATPTEDIANAITNASKIDVPTKAYARFVRKFETGSMDISVVDGSTSLSGATVTVRQMADSAASLFQGPPDRSKLVADRATLVDTLVATDITGHVTLRDLPPGTYEMRFSHPLVLSSGVEPRAVIAVVTPNAAVSARLQTPATQQVFDDCGNARGGVGIYGVVYEGEGQLSPFAIPAPASIVATWNTAEGRREERRTRADSQGRYALCGLPANLLILIQTSLARPAIASYGRGSRLPFETKVLLNVWRMSYIPITVPVSFDN